ncbi:hypothetical protein [Flavobacterium sp. B183]|uniref:hypothetical protein n=1 Tax=Flavobacterium sp. B183 TaxID=907046 RepID=UPI00201F94CF|nr:hypothetical protein [Flavobacterium sp. B183]URC13937.1 hypothetical protein M4I44_05945 [Flavobacterium sp. B183]URC14041.1 hypothetical protein M4I44_06535 [Flavobacterium sp. B183]
MWFDIDWKIFGIQMLPIKWRDSLTILFVKIILKPIDMIYYKWFNWRIDNIYKLEHSGQICYLRGSLNDKFDPIERRIYITDGQIYETTYVYTDAEDQDLFLEMDAEDHTIWLRTESETSDTGLDFIVFVPEEIFKTQIHVLHAHVKFYKTGGKRYNIFINE